MQFQLNPFLPGTTFHYERTYKLDYSKEIKKNPFCQNKILAKDYGPGSLGQFRVKIADNSRSC